MSVAHARLGRRDRNRAAACSARRRGNAMPEMAPTLDADDVATCSTIGASGTVSRMRPTDQARRAGRCRSLPPAGLRSGRPWARCRGAAAMPALPSRSSTALRGIYRTPWQMALQTWLEGVVPGERTFVRPSRRGADRHDVVMPGRKRECLDAQRRARHLWLDDRRNPARARRHRRLLRRGRASTTSGWFSATPRSPRTRCSRPQSSRPTA